MRAQEDALDAQNREYHDRLSAKTSYLKSLAFDMETEAKSHHRLLDDMDGDFEGASGLLSSTLSRVNYMSKSAGRGNRKILCYVALGLVFIVLILYAVFSHYFRAAPLLDGNDNRNNL